MTNQQRLFLEISNLAKEEIFKEDVEFAGRVAAMRQLCVIAGEIATDPVKARHLSARMIYDATDAADADEPIGGDLTKLLS